MLELIIVISIVSLLLTVAAPSISGLFKRQLLKFSSHEMIQTLAEIKSNSFLEHRYYKVQFNPSESSYSTWIFSNNTWELYRQTELPKQTIRFDSGMNETNAIIYGPNGHAYLCQINDIPMCINGGKLDSPIKLSILSNSKEVPIEIFPHHGIASSNNSVQ